MPEGTCSIDGCPNHAYKAGMCNTHYIRVRRYGDPHFSKIDRSHTGQPCSVESCNDPIEGHGLCHMHNTRRRDGKPLDDPRKGTLRLGTCSYGGCTNPIDSRGLCKLHYGRWWAGRPLEGPPEKVKPKCEAEGCETDAHCKGLCATHYHARRLAAKTARCSVEGCTDTVVSRGMCDPHYREDLRARKPPKAPKPCSIEGCDVAAARLGMCDPHYRAELRKDGRICTIDDCTKSFFGRDMCFMHYQRWRKWGDARANGNVSNTYWRDGDILWVTITGRSIEAKQVDVVCDAADEELVRQYRWRITASGYVQATVPNSGGKQVLMHRLFLGLAKEDKRVGDHINGDRADNRRENLRAVSSFINGHNRRNINNRGQSRYRGVSKTKHGSPWRATIFINYNIHVVGYFDTEDEAAEALAAYRKQQGLPAGY